jgi:hypothetical protein
MFHPSLFPGVQSLGCLKAVQNLDRHFHSFSQRKFENGRELRLHCHDSGLTVSTIVEENFHCYVETMQTATNHRPPPVAPVPLLTLDATLDATFGSLVRRASSRAASRRQPRLHLYTLQTNQTHLYPHRFNSNYDRWRNPVSEFNRYVDNVFNRPPERPRRHDTIRQVVSEFNSFVDERFSFLEGTPVSEFSPSLFSSTLALTKESTVLEKEEDETQYAQGIVLVMILVALSLSVFLIALDLVRSFQQHLFVGDRSFD